MKDKAGFTIIELAVVVLLLAFILFGLTPFVRDVQDKARQMRCVNNIQKISTGLRVYAYEHEGKLPEDLSLLWTKGYIDGQDVFDCPYAAGKGSAEKPDYNFDNKADFNSGENTPLVYDKFKNHRGGRVNILYLNGEIVNRGSEKLKEELETSGEKEKDGSSGAMAE